MKLDDRIQLLETLPVPEPRLSPEEVEATNIATAARCGFTREEVMAKFGDWPAFTYAVVFGKVVDPAATDHSAEVRELIARHNGNSMEAYLELVRQPRSAV